MKILVVDDNSDDRTLLRLIVERYGHQPIEAGDGQEGLRMAAAHQPDLIISDALMPGMDGFQFLKALKEDATLRAIPFIFYSAIYRAEDDVALARSLGAETYIFKPKAPQEFWTEVSRVRVRIKAPARFDAQPALVDIELLEFVRELLGTRVA